MCLAVPAQVLRVDSESTSAQVDYLGSQIVVGVALLESVSPGQFVLVHAGEAIGVVDPDGAQESLALWKGWLGL